MHAMNRGTNDFLFEHFIFQIAAYSPFRNLAVVLS